jgi:Spy/CpxP family protein refolding chaperone
MIKIISIFASAGLLLATTATLSADPGTHTPGATARQHNQTHRINQGVKSGELTQDEAQDLREDKRDIRQQKRAAKSDGTVTVQERKDLHKSLNESSQNIYEEKHDAEKR